MGYYDYGVKWNFGVVGLVDLWTLALGRPVSSIVNKRRLKAKDTRHKGRQMHLNEIRVGIAGSENYFGRYLFRDPGEGSADVFVRTWLGRPGHIVSSLLLSLHFGCGIGTMSQATRDPKKNAYCSIATQVPTDLETGEWTWKPTTLRRAATGAKAGPPATYWPPR